jgi:hypothetical protein
VSSTRSTLALLCRVLLLVTLLLCAGIEREYLVEKNLKFSEFETRDG